MALLFAESFASLTAALALSRRIFFKASLLLTLSSFSFSLASAKSSPALRSSSRFSASSFTTSIYLRSVSSLLSLAASTSFLMSATILACFKRRFSSSISVLDSCVLSIALAAASFFSRDRMCSETLLSCSALAASMAFISRSMSTCACAASALTRLSSSPLAQEPMALFMSIFARTLAELAFSAEICELIDASSSLRADSEASRTASSSLFSNTLRSSSAFSSRILIFLPAISFSSLSCWSAVTLAAWV
mmetsp:Transcript_6004/g.12442  ORF Transcript_6004/g.12442 Transcript_6004/m.12442 type:complete len:250 (-) Transcript_6004:988-1737(-)